MSSVLYDLAQSTIHKNQAIDGHLRFLDWLGRALSPGSRVLDFGCGVGHSVDVLLQRGFDAYGVDVLELWGKDHDVATEDYGATYVPPAKVVDRLCCFDQPNYAIPFPDGYFDFCFSDQVMEHVFNHAAAFREIVRVLKPGTISLHRFPGPNTLFEGHVHLPLPALCQSRIYLAAWALAGRRKIGKESLTWKEMLAWDSRLMDTVNYTTKRQLRKYALDAGIAIRFFEEEELKLRSLGFAGRVVNKLRPFGAAKIAAKLLSQFSQRYMALSRF